jgi:hypothetical protein
MDQHYLISITVSPAIEETLVDWLLQFDMQSGFTSFPVHGHSSRTEGLSLAEQVEGRKKRVRFQVHLPTPQADVFIAQLQRDFAGIGLHYWVSPLLEVGRI